MKKRVLIACVLPFFILSCDLFELDKKPRMVISWNIPDDDPIVYKLGEENNFWAQRLTNNSYYTLKAELFYIGEYCNIWVEKAGSLYSATKAEAKGIADVYDNEIYPKLMETFGVEFEFENGKKYNTMQIADFMGNYDGKLCILLLDIIDGYVENGPYVAGYFSPMNFYDNYPGVPSNKRDMIYIDTNPGSPGLKSAHEIVAHEMQHLMNFVTREMLGILNEQPSQMDLWINEGLSGAAEWAVFGHTETRINHYNKDPRGTIAKGNNFFVWDQYKDASVLDDYSTVYLFFQWLRIQNSNQIYKNIIKSNYSDYMAVTENAAEYNDNWENLIGDWLIANYINSSAGKYGYRGDSAFDNLTRHYIQSTNTSVSLFPGEGVFSYVRDSSFKPDNRNRIRYFGLSNAEILLGNIIPAGNALLTYNANSSNRGSSGRAETGTITGQTPPLSASSMARSVFGGGGVSEPYAISAEEMLRRNYE